MLDVDRRSKQKPRTARCQERCDDVEDDAIGCDGRDKVTGRVFASLCFLMGIVSQKWVQAGPGGVCQSPTVTSEPQNSIGMMTHHLLCRKYAFRRILAILNTGSGRLRERLRE